MSRIIILNILEFRSNILKIISLTEQNRQNEGNFNKKLLTPTKQSKFTSLELLILRFLVWGHNDACHIQSLLQQQPKHNANNGASVKLWQAADVQQLVFWRLNLPLFLLAGQISKKVILNRSVLQGKISKLFPIHVLKACLKNCKITRILEKSFFFHGKILFYPKFERVIKHLLSNDFLRDVSEFAISQ